MFWAQTAMMVGHTSGKMTSWVAVRDYVSCSRTWWHMEKAGNQTCDFLVLKQLSYQCTTDAPKGKEKQNPIVSKISHQSSTNIFVYPWQQFFSNENDITHKGVSLQSVLTNECFHILDCLIFFILFGFTFVFLMVVIGLGPGESCRVNVDKKRVRFRGKLRRQNGGNLKLSLNFLSEELSKLPSQQTFWSVWLKKLSCWKWQKVVEPKRIAEHEQKVDDLEQYTRRGDLLITGLEIKHQTYTRITANVETIEDSPQEELLTLEQQVVNKNIEIQPKYISICHTLPGKSEKFKPYCY